MKITIPDSLKAYIDEQVSERGYGTSSEYVRELILQDQGRLQLRGRLLEGAASAPGSPSNEHYFSALRRRIVG